MVQVTQMPLGLLTVVENQKIFLNFVHNHAQWTKTIETACLVQKHQAIGFMTSLQTRHERDQSGRPPRSRCKIEIETKKNPDLDFRSRSGRPPRLISLMPVVQRLEIFHFSTPHTSAAAICIKCDVNKP